MDVFSFIEALHSKNLDPSPKQMQQFEEYYQLLTSENKLYNLTAIVDQSGVYEKHFYDSLSPLFQQSLANLSLLDVGAGAGFPSLPLKIMEPSLSLYVLDSTAKKMHFIEKVSKHLWLEDVTPLVARAEEYKQQQFDVVVARGVASLPILLELVSQLVKVDGLFIAYKGPQYKIELAASQQAMKLLGFRLIHTQHYTLPSESAQRCNLFFKKTPVNDKMYPRSYSQIKQKPL